MKKNDTGSLGVKKLLQRAAALLRDAWLIAGITLALFLALEVAYKAQSSARRMLRGESNLPPPELATGHPNAGEVWWQDMYTGRDKLPGYVTRYDPFRGWWPRARVSRAINIDSTGRRITVQPAIAPGTHRTVYMFGGSVMWGWVVRDSFTIPSLVAARLRERGYADVEVVNLAQSMFDIAQNVATLEIELRHGRVPTVAVFLDGNNEVAPVRQSGEIGRVLNEAILAQRFSRRNDFGADLGALLRHSELVQRLTRGEDAPPLGTPEMCDAIAASYQRQTRLVEAVAEEFGFRPVFIWQPMLATSKKPRTAWERGAASDSTWHQMIQRCSSAAAQAMALKRGKTFYPLDDIFDADSTSVFIDDYGHVTERANGVIAEAIARLVAERLGPAAPPASRVRR